MALHVYMYIYITFQNKLKTTQSHLVDVRSIMLKRADFVFKPWVNVGQLWSGGGGRRGRGDNIIATEAEFCE